MQVRGTGVAKRDRLVPHRGQFFGRLGAAPSGNLMSESPNAAACGQELADCLIEIRLPSFFAPARHPGGDTLSGMNSSFLDEPARPGMPSDPLSAPGTSTGLLERTEEQKAPGDSERFAHYVRKEKLTEAMITGKPVVALCGKVWTPSRNPDRYPVCPTCRKIREEMGSGRGEWPFGPGVPGEG